MMESKAQIDKYIFRYCLEGHSDDPAILFLHGFMGDRLEFKQATVVLSKQFYCVTIDLLDHGQTETMFQGTYQKDHSYTIQSLANCVIEFLDLLRIERCFLVGYSMGGRLALYLTIHFPQYFHRVVLESASAGLRSDAERSDRLAKDAQLAQKLEAGNLRLFLENWYQQSIFANLRSHPDFSQLLAQRLNNSPLKLANTLRNLSLGKQPSLWERLATNEIPLLLLVGELDHKFVQINQQMQNLSKSAQLKIVPKCGHNIHFENPDLFIQIIKYFFCS